MNNDERDRLITEMHQDIKWLKEYNISHKNEHAKYIYYWISTLGLFLITWIKGR